MSIWQRSFTLEELNNTSEDTLVAHLGIQYVAFDHDSLTASMLVNSKTCQPFRILHGGATVALAETVGSMASNLAVNDTKYCVGLEINANHMKQVPVGESIFATAKPLHLGKQTHVWQIWITNDANKPIAASRLTTMILDIEYQK